MVDLTKIFVGSKSSTTAYYDNPLYSPFCPSIGDRRKLLEPETTTRATLTDSFLADLDELSDNEADLPVEDDGDVANMKEDVDSVSKLHKSQRFADIMQKVEGALAKGSDMSINALVLEDDPEYQFIVDCSALSVDIDNELLIIHNFIRDKYRPKFPELESLIHHPVDYARVVQKIGNEMDVNLVDLEGVLPTATIMVVAIAASYTDGKPLPEDVLEKIADACDRALSLDSAKKKVLEFIERRMYFIAPNLSAIVGSAVAANLMGMAGGLAALPKMPASNVQLLGAKKTDLAGFSTATLSQCRVGYLEETEIFQTTPPALRVHAVRLLSEKSARAAGVDSTRGDPSGNTGKAFREDINQEIEKIWQEQPKPLHLCHSKSKKNKKKRGGRRHMKTKEWYDAVIEMKIRKRANRMQIPEEIEFFR